MSQILEQPEVLEKGVDRNLPYQVGLDRALQKDQSHEAMVHEDHYQSDSSYCRLRQMLQMARNLHARCRRVPDVGEQ